MTKEERITAEKSLARFGDSIQIKDYGLALQIMHNQIVFAQKEASKISSNGVLSVSVCDHVFDWQGSLKNGVKLSCSKCGKLWKEQTDR